MLDMCVLKNTAISTLLACTQTRPWVFYLAGWAVLMKTWVSNTDVYVSN